MPRRLLVLALPCLLAACTTGHRVYHVAAAPGDVQGIYYALPRAVLSVDLEVTRHREIRGACHDELELKAGLGLIAGDPALRGKRGAKPKAQAQAQVQAAPVETPRAWASVRAEIRARAEVDPDEIYVIDARGRAFESLSASLELSETGLLHAAGLASEDRGLDIGLAVANTAIDLTTALLGATFAGEDTSTRCEVYFDEIKRLRGQRASIYSGEWRGLQGGMPRDSLDRILAGLDRHEAALLAHFTTTTRSEHETVTCTVTPSRADQTHLRGELQMLFPLVHIDRTSGAVSPADASVRCVIPPALRPEASASKGAAHPGGQAIQEQSAGESATAYLTLDLRADGLASLVATDRGCTARRNGRCASPQGLYYRVPREVRARVWWTQGSDDLAAQSLLIPQLGVTLALPPNTGRLSTKQAIRVYPESGALQSLEGESKTVSAEQIQRAADTSLRVIEASSRDRELLRLERERAVLEESVRIKEAREKLGEDDTGGASPGGERPGGASGGPGDRRDLPPTPEAPPPTRVNGGN